MVDHYGMLAASGVGTNEAMFDMFGEPEELTEEDSK
jgi:hypothetical protein